MPSGFHQSSAIREKLAISAGSTETEDICSGAVSEWAIGVVKPRAEKLQCGKVAKAEFHLKGCVSLFL